MKQRKKILSVILTAAMLLGNASAAFAEESVAEAAEAGVSMATETPDPDAGSRESESVTYYVSSLNGSSENPGTSEDQAFSSLLEINDITLKPGDKVLLERGSVFENEYLHIKGAGSADEPIIIGCYGDESKPLPQINTNGYGVWHQDYNIDSLDSTTHVLKGDVSSCILLYDVEYVEISDIAMTNSGNFADGENYSTADRMDRTGVAAVTQNIGTADHIVLRNLDISDIQGNVYNKHMCNGGIYMVCAQPLDESTGIAKYNDVLIEGCTLSNVNRWGIAVGYTCYWSQFNGAELPDDVVMEYGSTNVVVRNNYLSNLGGDGITMMYCYQPLVERNVVTAFARDMNNSVYTEPVSQKNGGKNRGGMLAAGIWPWKCKTPVFQYNECYDAYANQDGQAWDADSGDGCIYQYNYSSNNAGGSVMFCLQEAVNTVFRYNISQNDLGGVLNLSSNPNGEIYNNVFYIKENVPVNRMRNGTVNIYNNIFYYTGDEPAPASVCNWNWIRGKWSNNIYYNFSTIPDDPNAITEDPMFVDGGSAPAGAQISGLVYDRSVFDGYKLQEDSPAIDAGKPVSSAGGQDFFGNELDMMPDIGAYETGLYVADSNAEIVSTPYMITGEGTRQTINVPSLEKNPTTTEDVLANIEIAPKSEAFIFKGEDEAGRALVEDGMILRIYAESGVYRDYTIKVKNSYDFVEDYSSVQGNVWFYQYKSKDGTYSNMTAKDEWGGWMESYENGMSNTWATVARENNTRDGIVSGPLYNRNGADVESAAMAWRAPKAGSVTLSFGGGSVVGGAKLRGTTSGGPSYLKITKNGEDVIDPINMTESGGALIALESQVLKVEQGDYIRVECMTAADAENPGFYVTPVVSYNNTGDEEAPSVPGNVRASQIQGAKAVISWEASSDNVGVEGYNIYLDGELIATTASSSYQLRGLTEGGEYTVEVDAFDLANNVSERGSVRFTAEAENLIYTLPEPVELDGTEGGITLDQDVLDASTDLDELTVTAQFVGPTSLGSVISFSQSDATANHFHIYANGVTLGYEMRGEWGNYNAAVSCLEPGSGNAIAFVADPDTYTFKLFANGELVHTRQLNEGSWRMLSDYAGALDAVTVGWTPRTHTSKYPFVGDILDLNIYSAAFSDEDMTAYTNIDVPAPEKEPHMFSATGSLFYRIPALLTLSDGSLMAAVDARFGSAADSPNNLDTAVVFRQAGEEEWEDATIPFHFLDISDKAGAVTNNSASFIDPVIVQADDGTIYLMADAFPYGTGSARAQAGSGMLTVDGEKYLALTEKGNSVTDMENFTLYIKEDGTVWDSESNTATEYSVDENFNLYKNGSALTIQQRDPSLQYNGTRVPMNIFYEDAELQVYRTSYLWMASSSDGGKTWSAPQILNDLKLEAESFLGFGPGRGYVISRGEYEGRILIPVYSTEGSRGERSSVIYSDDNGKTWERGPATTVTNDAALNPGKTSEAQFVELPDGTIRMYARGTTGYVGYSDSADGVNYGPFKEDPQLAYCGNSMVSVINYSKTVDGKPALILSCPEHRENRKDGIIRIGLISENTDPSSAEKYTVDWKYRYEVNRDEFIYSCLTELPDGDIGLLYETHVDNGAPMNYAEYTLEELLVEEDSVIDSVELSPSQPEPGDEIRVSVTLREPAVNPEDLDTAVLEILYPASGLGKGTLSFEGISEDNLVLTYAGRLPESESAYEFLIRMPEWCSHPTVGKKSPVVETADGLINPANKDTLYGMASAETEPAPETDKSALEAVIADGDTYAAQIDRYTSETAEVFRNAYDAAKKVFADAEASQEEVDNAAAALQAAIDSLELAQASGEVSTAILEYALELAENVDTEGVIDSVAEIFNNTKAEAQDLLKRVQAGDATVTQSMVDQCWQLLIRTMQYMSFRQGDMTDLQKVVDMAKSLDLTRYLEEGKKEFTDALAAAETVLGEEFVEQGEIDQAWKDLLKAMSELRLKPSKEALEALVDQANSLNIEGADEETAAVFRSALARAMSVLDNSDAAEDEIAAAESELQAAIDQILAAAEDTSGKLLSDQSGKSSVDTTVKPAAGAGDETTVAAGSSKAAKTGDTFDLAVWGAVVLLSAGILVSSGYRKKKTK